MGGKRRRTGPCGAHLYPRGAITASGGILSNSSAIVAQDEGRAAVRRAAIGKAGNERLSAAVCGQEGSRVFFGGVAGALPERRCCPRAAELQGRGSAAGHS